MAGAHTTHAVRYEQLDTRARQAVDVFLQAEPATPASARYETEHTAANLLIVRVRRSE